MARSDISDATAATGPCVACERPATAVGAAGFTAMLSVVAAHAFKGHSGRASASLPVRAPSVAPAHRAPRVSVLAPESVLAIAGQALSVQPPAELPQSVSTPAPASTLPRVDAGPCVDTGPCFDTGPCVDTGPCFDTGPRVDAGPCPAGVGWLKHVLAGVGVVDGPGHDGDGLVTDGRAAARRRVQAELDLIDRACSRFRPDSELGAAQRGGRRLPVPGERAAGRGDRRNLRAAAVTDGAVDPTIGHALIVAGYDRDFATLPASTRRSSTRRGCRGGGWSRSMPPGVDHHAARCPARPRGDRESAGRRSGGQRRRAHVSRGRRPGRPRRRHRCRRPSAAGRLEGARDRRSPGARRRSGADGGDSLGRLGHEHDGLPLGRGASHHRPGVGRAGRDGVADVSVAAGNCVDANTASTAAIVRSAGALAQLEERGCRRGWSISTVSFAPWPAGRRSRRHDARRCARAFCPVVRHPRRAAMTSRC